jgi:hypothetical protein
MLQVHVVHEEHVEKLRGDERGDRDLHGRADVLFRVEAGRQHLHEDDARQSHRIAGERVARHEHVVLQELAVPEERCDERHPEHRERDRGGQREQQRNAKPPVEQARVGDGILAAVVLHEGWQQHRPQRHAQQRRRKFHQPVGVVEPRHRTVAEVGRDLRVDEERDLRHRYAQRRGRHEREDAPHAVVLRIPERPRPHADALEERELECELQDAAHEHRPRERHHGLLEVGASTSANAMKVRFSSTGVKAGALYAPYVLRSPEQNDTSEMKRMYGKQTRTIDTVRPNFAVSAAKPEAIA